MNQLFHWLKLAASVIFGIAGAVCVFVNFPLAGTLFLGSIAFSLMPE